MTAAQPFSTEEYRIRVAKVQRAMAEAGLDGLVSVDPSNMAWLTGYDGWSFYTPQAVILMAEGDPYWWGRGMDAPGAHRTVWMAGERVIPYEDRYVMNPPLHAMTDLGAVLDRLGLARARIGVESDNYYYSAASDAALCAALPDAHVTDATGLVNWQRAIKSPAEIEFMRRAGRIVTAMHRTIAEQARPGLPKHELIAEVYRTAIRGVGDAWGDYPAIVPMAPSGLDATAAHLTWDDAPLKAGESTFFEISGTYRRYHCPQCRTMFIGEPPARYRRAEEATLAAMDAGMAKLRPGNTCEDVAIAFYDTLARYGFQKDSRCGYPIGLSYPPDWGERTMSFRRGDTSMLQPGMTFHFMTALWLDDGGLELTEPLLVTEDGCELLAPETPRALLVL